MQAGLGCYRVEIGAQFVSRCRFSFIFTEVLPVFDLNLPVFNRKSTVLSRHLSVAGSFLEKCLTEG